MPVSISVERSRALRYLALIIVIAFFAACGSDNPVGISITGSTSRTLTVPAGSQFSVTLQTIGPGESRVLRVCRRPRYSSEMSRMCAHAFLPVRHSAFDFSRWGQGARSSGSRIPTVIPWSKIPFWSAESLW